MAVKELYVVLLMLRVCAWQAHAAVNCAVTGAGRHADLADPNCKNYTLCIYVKVTDSYLSYNTACPGPSVFNPKLAKCTLPSNFQCRATTIKPNPKNNIGCTAEGFIADPKAINCTTYLQCVEVERIYVEYKQRCPETTHFNPNSTFCEVDYKCTSFSCYAAGRVADYNDVSCRRYYYCVALYNGTYAQFNYICPAGSSFDPKSKLCTSRYVCGS